MAGSDMPPLNALRAFEATARLSSFKAAAAELFVTPTAVSHQIRQLEEYLGVRVLDRTPRSVKLTSRGKELYEATVAGFSEIRRSVTRLRESGTAAALTLSATTAFLSDWLVPRLAEIRRVLPEIDLRLHASETIVKLEPGERDVAISTGDGTQLSGWFYVPATTTSVVPGIVMSHGFGATIEHSIEQFAEVFAAAGFAVLLYDHRNFGKSGGQTRHEIDPWQQIRDTRDAITWLEQQTEIDPTRLGVWGTSYSGGHALVLAAIDRRLRCVVAQVPTISGYLQSLRRVRPDAVAASRRVYQADRIARYKGEPPTMRAIVANAPDDVAIYIGDCAKRFYLAMEERGAPGYWDNHVTLRSTEMSSEYEPGIYVSRISPTPVLMVVAHQDDVTPTDLSLDAYQQALEPKSLVLIRGGHFSPYFEKFNEASRAALDWFRLHLLCTD